MQRVNASACNLQRPRLDFGEPSHESRSFSARGQVSSVRRGLQETMSPGTVPGASVRAEGSCPLAIYAIAMDARRTRIGPPEGASVAQALAQRHPYPGPPLSFPHPMPSQRRPRSSSAPGGSALPASRAGFPVDPGGKRQKREDGAADADAPSSTIGPSPAEPACQVHPYQPHRSELVHSPLAPQTFPPSK